jgi:oligopeptide/dipeptide ABC transporter ATP-binding protein
MNELLRINGLKTHFFTDRGIVKAVDGVDLSLQAGDTLGIVGESGCGKTITSLSILQLVPSPGKIVAGSILFDGMDLTKLSSTAMRKIRGNKISMIFQESMASLNPVMKIGDQIVEVFALHQGFSKTESVLKAVEMLKLVGIPEPEARLKEYPHQLSGGMQQRVMIAMALACRPRLVIADEPTTALDVTIQAQILNLINRLKSEIGMSVIIITHDLGVVAETAQYVAVMYAGNVVEYTDVTTLYRNPLHPYTQGLWKSIPMAGTGIKRKETLPGIAGVVPNVLNLPPGCRFADRCSQRLPECSRIEPELRKVAEGHLVRCWKHV